MNRNKSKKKKGKNRSHLHQTITRQTLETRLFSVHILRFPLIQKSKYIYLWEF